MCHTLWWTIQTPIHCTHITALCSQNRAETKKSSFPTCTIGLYKKNRFPIHWSFGRCRGFTKGGGLGSCRSTCCAHYRGVPTRLPRNSAWMGSCECNHHFCQNPTISKKVRCAGLVLETNESWRKIWSTLLCSVNSAVIITLLTTKWSSTHYSII